MKVNVTSIALPQRRFKKVSACINFGKASG